MCGSDTLTTVVSSTSMKVPNITAIATIQGLTCRCSLVIARVYYPPTTNLFRVDLRCNGHAGAQHLLRVLLLVDRDADRHALDNLHEVAGRVFRWQQAEARSGRRREALDVRLEVMAAVGINFNHGGLSRTHVFQLRLLEIRGDPHFLERNDGHQRLSWLHDLPKLDALPADDPSRRRLDRRVFEI